MVRLPLFLRLKWWFECIIIKSDIKHIRPHFIRPNADVEHLRKIKEQIGLRETSYFETVLVRLIQAFWGRSMVRKLIMEIFLIVDIFRWFFLLTRWTTIDKNIESSWIESDRALAICQHYSRQLFLFIEVANAQRLIRGKHYRTWYQIRKPLECFTELHAPFFFFTKSNNLSQKHIQHVMPFQIFVSQFRLFTIQSTGLCKQTISCEKNPLETLSHANPLWWVLELKRRLQSLSGQGSGTVGFSLILWRLSVALIKQRYICNFVLPCFIF